MRKQIRAVFLAFAAVYCAQAQLSPYDYNAPFGWAVCTSLTSGDDYALTGGGNGTSITLKSNGGDMRTSIDNAIRNYDVIILDGSAGDFTVSSSLSLKNICNKTIVGINNARLCTQFHVTDEIKAVLDSVGVKNMSGSSGGGTLVNGSYVKEEGEFFTRKTLIELSGDQSERYRKSGVFTINGCENFIIRNLSFIGPGSVDVGGYDLISVVGSTHLWIDHCSFTDGMDGNLDITNKADFVTVSWCTFAYSERSYAHAFSNLIAGSDDPSQGEYNLNVTWANCWWKSGCKNRMPMARFGVIHLYDNFYDCPGASVCINPQKDSDFLIENNYFSPGVNRIFSQKNATAYVWHGNLFSEPFTPTDRGSVHIPYTYTLYNASEVEATVSNSITGAGNTLKEPLDMTPNQTSARNECDTSPALVFTRTEIVAADSSFPIYLYSANGVLVGSGKGKLDTTPFSQGYYITHCGKEVVRIVIP